jgi:hypothetical protein
VQPVIDRTKKITKKGRVRDYAAIRGWTRIGEEEWKELRSSLPAISESTMRAAGLSIAQPWRGVIQHSLEDLKDSLSELSVVYENRPDLRRYCREQVIAAKDRARRLSASKPLKAEMVEWMLVWLGDPSMFATWVEVRLRQLA